MEWEEIRKEVTDAVGTYATAGFHEGCNRSL